MTPVEALQATLAGEHAATYVFGVLGAQTSRSAQPRLYADVDLTHSTHRTQRDRLAELVRRSGADPVAAAVSYVLPNSLADASQVRLAAREVESRCTDLYGQLVENSTGATRAWAITALSAGALRSVGFGAPAEPFPGLTAP